MPNQEFIQQKQKYWEEFKQKHKISRADGMTVDAFIMAFDRAYALGKQEKEAEDTVISGWVAIDELFNECFLHTEKPIQKEQPIADTGDYNTLWNSKGKIYLLDTDLFPYMDSDSDPIEVELIIKRKKK